MTETLETLLAPVAEAQGCELYDIEYVKEGSDRILRLYIDKEDGIDIDDCERVSRAVEVVLDEHDPIPGEYRLQVSSPGVERKLKKPAHFARFVGSKVEVRIYAPLDPVSGRKKFTGKLINFDDNVITIKAIEDNQDFTFDLKQVSSCRLVVFD
ncbi:MAG: ribosome maturation factor RimP [Firmicutes bacterium]|nr:ribosome maturation factor RimP [Bacillota bacterium]